MQDEDETQRTPRPTAAPADLSRLSVEDLERHIATLKAELVRAEAVLVEKRRYRDQAAALFRTP